MVLGAPGSERTHDSSGNQPVPGRGGTDSGTLTPKSDTTSSSSAPAGLPTIPTAQAALLDALTALPPADRAEALQIIRALPTLPPAIRAGIRALVQGGER